MLDQWSAQKPNCASRVSIFRYNKPLWQVFTPASAQRSEVSIPSYIPDLDDALATWYQATNDGSGWKLEKHQRPLVGDYLHSEFRQSMTVSAAEVESQICAILAQREPTAKTAVCRLDRTGRTLDGWRQRTINMPVGAALAGRATPRLPDSLPAPNRNASKIRLEQR